MKILLIFLILLAAPTTVARAPEAVVPEAESFAEAVRRFHVQDFESAEKLLLMAREGRPKDAEIAFYLGRVYLEQSRFKEAVETIERAARLDPASSMYRFWLGEALVERVAEVAFLFKLRIARRIREAYEKAVELDPGNLDARVAVALYHSEAPAIVGGNPARADAELVAIGERDPALAHVTRGLIHERLGRLEPAEEHFRIAAEVDPESVPAWREAGFFYQRLERWDDAQRAFEEVLARAPDDPAALVQAARTAIAISDQQLRRAEQALRRYLRLEPAAAPLLLNEAKPTKRVDVLHQLGRLYERQGRPELAINEYRIAVELDAGDEEARDSLARVRGDCPLVGVRQ